MKRKICWLLLMCVCSRLLSNEDLTPNENDRAWQDVWLNSNELGPVSKVYEAASQKWGDGTFDFWLDVSRERQRFWDAGQKFWEKHPADSRRFRWLYRMLETPPFFWDDEYQGAKAYAARSPQLARVDMISKAGWMAAYLPLRAAFIANREGHEFPGAGKRAEAIRNNLRYFEWRSRLIELLYAARRKERLDLAAVAVELLDFVNASDIQDFYAKALISQFMLCADYDIISEAGFVAALSLSPNETIAKLGTSLVARTQLRKQPLSLRLPGLRGEGIDLSVLRGKVILVDIWSNGCGACVEAMPEIQRTYERYRHQGFEVVGVWAKWTAPNGAAEELRAREADEMPRAIEYLSRQGATWRNGILYGNSREEFLARYGIQGFPATWLIGRDGRLVATDLHGPLLEAAVRRLVEND